MTLGQRTRHGVARDTLEIGACIEHPSRKNEAVAESESNEIRVMDDPGWVTSRFGIVMNSVSFLILSGPKAAAELIKWM